MPISSSWGFLTLMKHTMYHLLTVNVRTRTEINILHIHFVTVNSQDSVALSSSLRPRGHPVDLAAEGKWGVFLMASVAVFYWF